MRPDLFEQLLAGEHRLGFARERDQQVELGRRQVHLLAVDRDQTLCRVDDQRAEVEDLLVLGVLRDDLRAFHAAQQRLAAGDQLAHGERLGHVIVGARAEADDLVRLGVAGGQDEHRHRAVGHDALGCFKTIHDRQHDVHDYQVRAQLLGGLNRAGAVGRHAGGPSLRGDALSDGGGEGRLILDHQNGPRRRLTCWRINHDDSPFSFPVSRIPPPMPEW